MSDVFEFLRNVFAVIGLLVTAVLVRCCVVWVWSRRADRKSRAPLDIPPADDPAWDRLFADLLQQKRERP